MNASSLQSQVDALVQIVNPSGWTQIESRADHDAAFNALRQAIKTEPALLNAHGSQRGYGLLHHLAWGAGNQMGQYLLEQGADPCLQADGGLTPLSLACGYGQAQCPLARQLATVGRTPDNLRVAASLGEMDRVDSIVNAKSFPSTEAFEGREPWDAAYGFAPSPHSNDPERVLLDALAFAARNGQLTTAQLLLDQGIDVNGIDYLAPALHWAALYNQNAMVDFLIASGARLDLRDREYGATASEWAAYFKNDALASKLARAAGT